MTAQSKINLARLPLRLLFAVEALALYSSLYIASSLRSGGLIDNVEAITPRAIVLTGVMLLGLSSMGLYRFHQRFYFHEIFGRIIAGLIFGTLSLIVIGYAVPALEATAAIGAISALYSLAMLLMIRFFFRSQFERNIFRRNTLVYGAGASSRAISDLRRKADRRGFRITSRIITCCSTCLSFCKL
jgi:FlaA1/EpsC-like NDP-sugar epimerase